VRFHLCRICEIYTLQYLIISVFLLGSKVLILTSFINLAALNIQTLFSRLPEGGIIEEIDN